MKRAKIKVVKEFQGLEVGTEKVIEIPDARLLEKQKLVEILEIVDRKPKDGAYHQAKETKPAETPKAKQPKAPKAPKAPKQKPDQPQA